MTVIKEIEKNDLDAVAAIAEQCFSQPWSKQSFGSELRKGSVMLAAATAGRIDGYIVMEILTDEGYIHNVAVADGLRRRGTAKLMMSAVLERAQTLGLKRVLLDVRVSNQPAQSLYRLFGFETIARRRCFYSSPVEDGFTMARDMR